MNAKAGEKTQTDKALSDHIRNKINLKKKKNFSLGSQKLQRQYASIWEHTESASWLKDQLEHKYNVSKLEEHSPVALQGPFTP